MKGSFKNMHIYDVAILTIMVIAVFAIVYAEIETSRKGVRVSGLRASGKEVKIEYFDGSQSEVNERVDDV